MTSTELLQLLEQNPEHKIWVNGKVHFEVVQHEIDGEQIINLISG